MSILLVDDDVELCSLMREFLAAHGFDVACAHDGPSGLSQIFDAAHDIVILDVMLPRLDGFEVLRRVRSRSDVPVILLTARGGHDDRIQGFDAGADDYLSKPFMGEELLARIRAVIRRSQGGPKRPESDLVVGPVRLNGASRLAWNGVREIDLTSAEFDLLELLMRAAGRVVSRDEIAGALHQRDASPFDRSLDVHVSHLRKKLAPDGEALLRTVRGVGYFFSGSDKGPAPEGP